MVLLQAMLKLVGASEDKELLFNQLDPRKSPSENIYSRMNRADFQTILPTRWVKGPILDTYGMYLTSQAQLKVFIPSVFFINKMMVKGRRPEQRKYDFDRAKCWTKGLDIHVVNRVILPMLRGTDHWCCYLVDMDSQEIIEYDSRPAKLDNNRVTALRRWVSDESAKSRGEQHRLNTVKWKARVGVCPQQSNGYDCGVFVACLMRSLAMNMPFTFSQGTIDIERANIALHLLKYFATTNPNRAVGSVEE
eukprot:gb/GECG01014496.1/.p1 GENE.gb/GECG01014496.1/~~gb/GECG01014496.1/.p1  ORF type:complete len:249 (+),score=14.17 gb/GECG01014496.1/:1-747(+)